MIEENKQLKALVAQTKHKLQNLHCENEFFRNENQKPKYSAEDYEKQQKIIQSLTVEKTELQNAFCDTIAKQNQSEKFEVDYKVNFFLILIIINFFSKFKISLLN